MRRFRAPPQQYLFVVVCASEHIDLHFGRTMGDGIVYPRSLACLLTSSSSITVMAESPRILSTLQRIAETARRINLNSRPACTKPSAPTILKSLPEHKPLLPLLLSYGIPSKLAQTCADRYDKYANQLRSEAEIKFAPYLLKRQSHAAGVYSLFLDSYSQALRRWAQSILNAALKSLKRSSVELGNLDVTHPKPLWLPVRLLILDISGMLLTIS